MFAASLKARLLFCSPSAATTWKKWPLLYSYSKNHKRALKIPSLWLPWPPRLQLPWPSSAKISSSLFEWPRVWNRTWSGSLMSLTSTRSTLTPHGSVPSSKTEIFNENMGNHHQEMLISNQLHKISELNCKSSYHWLPFSVNSAICSRSESISLNVLVPKILRNVVWANNFVL